MSQLSEFVRMIRSSVIVFFNNFLLIDATDRSKISSDQKRLFFAVSLYPSSFFANTPFKGENEHFHHDMVDRLSETGLSMMYINIFLV